MSETGKGESRKKVARVIAKAWADEGYKKRLAADPMAVLAEEGIDVPQGVTVKVVEETEEVRFLVLPMPGAGGGAQEMEERLAATIGMPY